MFPLNGPHFRTLQRALEALGSKERLAAVLDVDLHALDTYLNGEKPLPQDLYIAALDIVASSRR